MARVTRIGVDEAQRELAAMAKGEEVLEKVGRPALRVGGEAAVALAEARSPHRSGRFAASIHMEEGGAGGAASGETEDLELPADTATSVGVAVGTTLFYGKFVEFGRKGERPMAGRWPVRDSIYQIEPVIEDALDHYMGEWLGEG